MKGKLFIYIFIMLFFGQTIVAQNELWSNSKFIRAKNTFLLDSTGVEFLMKGIGFGNWVATTITIPTTHHSEIDFERVKKIGFNTIRFYFDSHTLEDEDKPYHYKKEGWEWLDKNIAWARKYNVYLLLDMHVPPGGFQSFGKGDALWNELENQNRLAVLWKAIAKRYKNENIILGYGLLNEPTPTNSLSQWQQLAERLKDSIRTVDKNHTLFMEAALYIKNGVQPPNPKFAKINDNNVVYEFHVYDPMSYTHQLFDWAGANADGGSYPDENSITLAGEQWYSCTTNDKLLAAGSTEWQFVESDKFKITNKEIKAIKAALSGGFLQNGAVFFDAITIKEFDKNEVATGKEWPFNTNSTGEWYYWSKTNTGKISIDKNGNKDTGCLKITGSQDDASMSSTVNLIEAKQGFFYQITGFIRGENISTNAKCNLRMDFYTSKNEVGRRNKKMLAARLIEHIDWSVKNNVPLFLGEFGAGQHCFENNKGGLNWVADMLDLCQEKKLNFNYHAYHENAFGLYLGWGTAIEESKKNSALINLFKRKLQ
jgi:endoglucanase